MVSFFIIFCLILFSMAFVVIFYDQIPQLIKPIFILIIGIFKKKSKPDVIIQPQIKIESLNNDVKIKTEKAEIKTEKKKSMNPINMKKMYRFNNLVNKYKNLGCV